MELILCQTFVVQIRAGYVLNPCVTKCAMLVGPKDSPLNPFNPMSVKSQTLTRIKAAYIQAVTSLQHGNAFPL